MACQQAEMRKKSPKHRLVIALDDLDFSWTKHEIRKAIMLWNSGYSIQDMAKQLRPYDGMKDAVDEVALLIMHLKRQGKITNREGGVMGNGI